MAFRVRQSWSVLVRGGDRQIAETFGIDPVTARVLLNRDLKEEDEIRRYLYGTLEDLEDPETLDQAAEAAALIHDCVRKQQHIRIIGDYDADGIFSVYILYHTLKLAGAVVSYDVPDRVTDGFGMSMRLVENAGRDGVGLLITCDNGIAQLDEVLRAKELGMRVIITDHHEPNYTLDGDGSKRYRLSEADVVVDPKIPGCRYPNKDLCGAGVAWKLMYLYERRYLTDGGNLRDCPSAMEHLPFAAAATVTDIMRLTGENRILVKEGLSMLSGTGNTGMRALIACCGLEGRQLTGGHIGFIIGPCLNASGRLDSARQAVDLLLQTDQVSALASARTLSALNEQRKQMTEEGTRKACGLIESTGLIHDRVLIVYLEGIHESVAGIIASRIKETYHRPVIVFTDTENALHLKGSGRSIEAYHMHEALSEVSDLLVRFGGHPMAAGVTIRRENLERLRGRINANCRLTEEDLMQKVLLDAAIPLSYLSEDLIRELSMLEPFGPGNSGPLFGASKVRLLKLDVPGRKRNVVKLLVDDGSSRATAVWFGDADAFLSYLREKGGEEQTARLLLGRENELRLTIAYKPVIHEYRQERSIQLQIAHFQ